MPDGAEPEQHCDGPHTSSFWTVPPSHPLAEKYAGSVEWNGNFVDHGIFGAY